MQMQIEELVVSVISGKWVDANGKDTLVHVLKHTPGGPVKVPS